MVINWLRGWGRRCERKMIFESMRRFWWGSSLEWGRCSPSSSHPFKSFDFLLPRIRLKIYWLVILMNELHIRSTSTSFSLIGSRKFSLFHSAAQTKLTSSEFIWKNRIVQARNFLRLRNWEDENCNNGNSKAMRLIMMLHVISAFHRTRKEILDEWTTKTSCRLSAAPSKCR